jgi:NAD(P)-dependent dehydrogenase (short-subunit alcohol dehydrogenase family)
VTKAVVVGGDARFVDGLSGAGYEVVDAITTDVTVVVHAAAPAPPMALMAMDDDAWSAAALDPVAATTRTLQAAVRDGGRPMRILVVVPSEGLVGASGHVAACTAGEAQRALAKGAARTWGGDDVTVNVLAVPMASEAQVRTAALPPGDDVVANALWLLSDGARRTTGVTIVADGGTTMLP